MTRDDPAAFAPPPAFGPFRVLHQIGIGALGPVFRTYEPTRDRLVAVKVFRLDITPEQSEALATELAVAADAGLFHPSIVEPVGSGVEGTVAYRAEEYVAADSLDVAIRQYAPASLSTALPLITQLAGAIDFARTAGVGHGALHLRDVFVTPDEARASGFGVVEALERVGIRAPVRRPYSAPERIAGEPWGTPADVFSLAAIAFELLTARRPTGTGDQIGAFPAEMFGRYSAAIHEVLGRAMHDDPARRHRSALALASALEAAARGGHVSDAVHALGTLSAATGAPRVPGPPPAPVETTMETRTESVPGPHKPTEDPAPAADAALERTVEPVAVERTGLPPTVAETAPAVAIGETLLAVPPVTPPSAKRRRTTAIGARAEAADDAASDTPARPSVIGASALPASSILSRGPGEIQKAPLERLTQTQPLPVIVQDEAARPSPAPLDRHGLEAQEDAAIDAEARLVQVPEDDPAGAADVAAERDSDAAHHELLRREVAGLPQPMLFQEEEAAADFAPPAGQTPDRFADPELDGEDWRTTQIGAGGAGGPSNLSMDFGAPQSSPEWNAGGVPTGDDAVSAYGDRQAARGDDGQGMSAERPRPATLPLAITLVLGLLVGFAAGYSVADRSQASRGQIAASPANPPPAAPGSAATARPQTAGKDYSEQSVAQPSPPGSAGARREAPPRTTAAAAPAPAPAARPAATTGRIVVTSTPSNVGVLLNGKWRGRTPLTIDALKFGDYAVRTVQPGLSTARQDVRLSAGEPVRSVVFKLERTSGSPAAAAAPRAAARGAAAPVRGYLGSIYVDSRPSGAKVTIDGRAMGTTPARIPDLAIGSHVVKLELANHRPWTASTRVAVGTETRVTGSLERIP